jgi:hypothetical protein
MTGSIRTATTEDQMPTFTTTTPRPSAAQGLRSYGLASIELQRASERRATEATRLGADDRSAGLLHRVRRIGGELMIRIGAGIAGDHAAPTVNAGARPRIDMA